MRSASWHIDDQRHCRSTRSWHPPGTPGKPERSGKHGIYFNARVTRNRELERDMPDPGFQPAISRDIIPRAVRAVVVVASVRDEAAWMVKPGSLPYWRDVGNNDRCLQDITSISRPRIPSSTCTTMRRSGPIQPQLPPAKFVHNQDDRRGVAIESLVSGGCIVSGRVFRSVLFPKCARPFAGRGEDWSALPGVTCNLACG